MAEHTEFAEFHEGYVRHYIALADTKASVIFGVAASILAYLFSQATLHQILFEPRLSADFIQAAIAVAFLVLAAGCAGVVMIPRLTHTGEGLVFFAAVAQFKSAENYLDHVRRRSASELTAARIKHCYDVSKVCARKYDMLRRAIWFGILALIAVLPILATVAPPIAG